MTGAMSAPAQAALTASAPSLDARFLVFQVGCFVKTATADDVTDAAGAAAPAETATVVGLSTFIANQPRGGCCGRT